MIAVSEQSNAAVRPQTLAPWLHTLCLFAVLVLWAIYGTLRLHLPLAAMPRDLTYVSAIIVQCLLVGSTIAGLYQRRQFIESILGKWSLRNAIRDFAKGILICVGGLILISALSLAIRFTPLHSTYQREAVRGILPHSISEMTLWVFVSISAGISEELVFRGYFLQQLTGWFRSGSLAIAVSALVFGAMHFYQGAAAVVPIAGLGVLYALVATRQGNLRSVMVAHALHDVITGLAHFWRA